MSAKQSGFSSRAVYKVKHPKMLHLAKQKLSFTVALLSLFAFVAGNMVGQHGWYAFWKTVLGKEDDALIAFVGTVSPIAKVPDYTAWAAYGGSKQLHTFAQVPASVLRDIPAYDQSALTAGTASDLARQTYSTLWAGGYNSPHGSHAGVDIDVPLGTPVVSIGNGVVEKVSRESIGFGNYILIRHPNVPDLDRPGTTSTLYSTYAHLDQIEVTEGQVVHKGERIGTVGNTGTVFGMTGYHLYFQVERDTAPFRPYWPFTSADARSYGLSFYQAVNSTQFRGNVLTHTLNPMAFVDRYSQYTPSIAQRSTGGSTGGVAAQVATVSRVSSSDRMRMLSASRASRRAALRIAEGRQGSQVVETPVMVSSQPSSSAPVIPNTQPIIVTDVKTAGIDTTVPVPSGGVSTDVQTLSIDTSGKLLPTWQKVRISALDGQGNIVQSPSFTGRLYVVSDFGEAVIRPSELSPLDFVNGVATVNVLARGTKTTFISTRGAFNVTSGPMTFDR